MPCARTHSRRTRCESATTGVGAGAAWSMKTQTRPVSQTCSFPSSRIPVITASMTESCTITRESGTITSSPARTSRPDALLRIFSASVFVIAAAGPLADRARSRDHPLAEQAVQLVHRQGTVVRHGLDASGDVLELLLAELEPELLRAVADRVAPGETMRDVDRAREAEVRGVEDLVRVRVHVDRLRVHARLVVERVPAGHVLVERDLDADHRGDHLVQVLQLAEVVLLLDRLGVVRVHAGDEAAERRDPVALADAEHARVDVSRAALEDRVRVRDRAAGVVEAMELDVRLTDVMAELDRERVALSRRRDADGVGDADAVDAHLRDGRIHLQEVAFEIGRAHV